MTGICKNQPADQHFFSTHIHCTIPKGQLREGIAPNSLSNSMQKKAVAQFLFSLSYYTIFFYFCFFNRNSITFHANTLSPLSQQSFRNHQQRNNFLFSPLFFSWNFTFCHFFTYTRGSSCQASFSSSFFTAYSNSVPAEPEKPSSKCE